MSGGERSLIAEGDTSAASQSFRFSPLEHRLLGVFARSFSGTPRILGFSPTGHGQTSHLFDLPRPTWRQATDA
jgi:hypothetical protein